MKNHNANNERIKRKYLTFLKQAKGQNEASIDAVAKAIARFESYNKQKDFKAFHFEQAIGFKKHLAKQKHHRTGKPLTLATMNGALRHLKGFIEWLSQETGYKVRIKYSDAEYFNLSEKEARTAKATRQKPVASVEQIKHVLEMMPNETAIEKRDRALIAFTLLTGARDRAIASLKLKHIDLKAGTVYQDAREVNTKFSKTFTPGFFPVGDDVRDIVIQWVEYLKSELLMGNNAPLFPKTKMSQDCDNSFKVAGLACEHWSNAAAIRRIFKNAFLLAELPNFNPHSFRNTLAALGESLCQSPEEFKAWSQNLGHEGVLTTFLSYGEVQPKRQVEIIQNIGLPREATTQNINTAELAKAVAREIQNQAVE
ncbi:MAG TPA: site-specific integrase [Nitrospiria bacterium]|nr:site-specific integrase [Candidatus Manganitrophaceae bacterium]